MNEPSEAAPIVQASALARPWVAVVGALLGSLTLLFLMALVLLSVYGREVPCNSVYLVCAVLSIGAALAVAFIGGNASATGNIPLDIARTNPLSISVGGGVAVLLIMLVVTTTLFKRADCETKTSGGAVNFIVALSQVPRVENWLSLWTVYFGQEPNSDQHALIIALGERNSGSAPAQYTKVGKKLTEARTVAQIQSALDKYDFVACGGDFRFEIKDGLLVCSNGYPVTYIRSPSRSSSKGTELIVLHHTASASSLGSMVNLFSGNTVNASYHIIISRSGAFVQLVPFDSAAWHAGDSKWKGAGNVNSRSIGISFINVGQVAADGMAGAGGPFERAIPREFVVTIKNSTGETTYWQGYTEAQIAVAAAIIKAIYSAYGKVPVVGHENISATRRDPGPAFPFSKLCQAVGCPNS